jgi:hypothetical protein
MAQVWFRLADEQEAQSSPPDAGDARAVVQQQPRPGDDGNKK